MVTDVVSNIANIMTTASVILAVLFYFKDKKRSNKLATLEAYDRLQRDVFDELNQWKPQDVREAMSNHSSEEYVQLSVMLARIEHFCAGIQHRIFDFEIFRDISKGYFGNQRGKLYGRILPILEEKTDGADSDYYKNLIEVWRRCDTS